MGVVPEDLSPAVDGRADARRHHLHERRNRVEAVTLDEQDNAELRKLFDRYATG